MPKVVNVHDAKTNLSRLLERVKAGEEFVLAKSGKPYARLVPFKRQKRELGFLDGTVPEDFFEPLPEEELRAWEQ
jgi:prevent-host-death family protein